MAITVSWAALHTCIHLKHHMLSYLAATKWFARISYFSQTDETVPKLEAVHLVSKTLPIFNS